MTDNKRAAVTDDGSRITVSGIKEKNVWNDLFDRVAFPHMTQAWAFGQAKRATGWYAARLVLRRGEEPVAICQVLFKRFLGIPLVARINQGPMMLRGHEDRELDAHVAIRDYWHQGWHGLLLISCALPGTPTGVQALLDAGFRRRGNFQWTSSRVDLTRSESDLRKSLDSKWRNQLKKAESHMLGMDVGHLHEDAKWIAAKHARNMKDKHFDGPSKSLVRALFTAAAPDEFLVMQVIHAGKAVAGAVIYKFGKVAHYYVGWYSDEARQLNAGNFLLWKTVVVLKWRGCEKFDLGGHNNAVGFGKFKLGMNGEGYQSAGEFMVAPRLLDWIFRQ